MSRFLQDHQKIFPQIVGCESTASQSASRQIFQNVDLSASTQYINTFSNSILWNQFKKIFRWKFFNDQNRQYNRFRKVDLPKRAKGKSAHNDLLQTDVRNVGRNLKKMWSYGLFIAMYFCDFYITLLLDKRDDFGHGLFRITTTL